MRDPEPYFASGLWDAPEVDSGADPGPEDEEPYQSRRCDYCGFEGEDWDAHCEKCGRPFSTWGILRDPALV